MWKAQDVFFSGSNSFEILPVFNAMDTPINQDIIVFLTSQLKEQFTKQNLQLIDTPETRSGVLTVQSDILFYKKMSQSIVGTINYTVKISLLTRLVDKPTTSVVAKISTTKSATGKYSGNDIDKLVLRKSAEEIAKEVAKLVLPKEAEPGIWQKI